MLLLLCGAVAGVGVDCDGRLEGRAADDVAEAGVAVDASAVGVSTCCLLPPSEVRFAGFLRFRSLLLLLGYREPLVEAATGGVVVAVSVAAVVRVAVVAPV